MSKTLVNHFAPLNQIKSKKWFWNIRDCFNWLGKVVVLLWCKLRNERVSEQCRPASHFPCEANAKWTKFRKKERNCGEIRKRQKKELHPRMVFVINPNAAISTMLISVLLSLSLSIYTHVSPSLPLRLSFSSFFRRYRLSPIPRLPTTSSESKKDVIASASLCACVKKKGK